jgi:CRISPR-associated protein Cas2
MSYRFMRTLIFFDLPTETAAERREYRRFRKLLIQNGFVMMQKSVYCRMLINASQERAVLDVIRRNRPAKGIVQVLSVTEKQFSKIEFITGEYHTDVVTGDERLVIL